MASRMTLEDASLSEGRTKMSLRRRAFSGVRVDPRSLDDVGEPRGPDPRLELAPQRARRPR